MAKQRSKITKQHTGSIVSPLTSSIPDDADAEMRVPREQHQQHDGNDSDSDSDSDGNDIIAASTTTPTTNTYSEQRKNESRKSNKEGSSKSSKVRTMSQSKLMEEAALTALLFGGGGDGNDTMGGRSVLSAMAEFDTNDTIGTATSWAELDRIHSNASYSNDEDLFAIDRSGEEVRADNDNENDNADEYFMDEEDEDKMDGNRDDYEDEDEESMIQGKLDSKSNKAMMTGAAWDDSDSEEESHNSDDDDNEEDQFSVEGEDISEEEYEEEADDAHAKRRSKKQRKGVSLVDGPNRLKKLRRYADETNPLSFKEYELRLRERFITTASVAARTDWADVGLAKQLQDQHQQQDADANTISGKRQKKKRGGYKSSSDSDDDDDDDDDDAAERILESNASLFDTSTNGGRRSLPPTILDILRCRDGNLQDPNNSVVSATQFHPNSDEDNPLLMTAGLDKMLRFFRIGDADDDSETNSTKIHGIHLPQLPITCASFLGSGTLASSVILSGRRPFFYVYDAVSGNIQKIAGISGRAERSLERFRVSPDGRVIAFVGNDGYVILVDGKTRQWIGELKMNGSVRALTFTEDSEYILGSGSDGDVYRWHIGSRRCVERFHNEDGTITSSLALSSKFLAVGAESGVVNLYNDKYSSSMQFNGLSSRGHGGGRGGLSLTNTERTPHKSIMNLTTSADNLCFNSTGDILAMSSKREKNGLKLLHVPSATVFSNWPTSKTPLKYVWSMDFSPGSKYLAVGNDHGKVLLYRVKHYWD